MSDKSKLATWTQYQSGENAMEKPDRSNQHLVWYIQYMVGLKSRELGPFYSQHDVDISIPRLKTIEHARSITYYTYWEQKVGGHWVGAGGMRVYNERHEVVFPPQGAV